jgi:hypothetical protein
VLRAARPQALSGSADTVRRIRFISQHRARAETPCCCPTCPTRSERLGLAFDASLLTTQSLQTEISRRLAAWAAILAVPTATAGIYGMNFNAMPELQWRYGYPVVLAAIGAVCAGLYYGFRRAKWL